MGCFSKKVFFLIFKTVLSSGNYTFDLKKTNFLVKALRWLVVEFLKNDFSEDHKILQSGDKRNAAPLNVKIVRDIFHKIRMGLSWAINFHHTVEIFVV